MAQYRFRTAAIVGEWRRTTRREACEDAIRVCLARRDPAEPDGIRFVVPTEIESQDASAPAAENDAFERGYRRRRA